VTAFFAYPKATAYGRVVPKSKIYEHAGTGSALKDKFVTEVDQIIWSHKLAPETLNLAATASVTEIQVFEIRLRTGDCDSDVLRALDRAIPFPLIFELVHGDRRKVVAAYKRPSETDHSKWVVSEYFHSPWEAETGDREPLPVALDLGGLYDQLLSALMPPTAVDGDDIRARIARAEAVRAAEREIARIKVRLDREKQFNRRVAINAELREAQRAFEHLKKPH
jgi:Domain of unknown function (DUF4391)